MMNQIIKINKNNHLKWNQNQKKTQLKTKKFLCFKKEKEMKMKFGKKIGKKKIGSPRIKRRPCPVEIPKKIDKIFSR